MKEDKNKNSVIDKSTRQYMKNIRCLHLMVLLIVSTVFLLFAYKTISSNKRNLKETALAEVEESMQETVNNVAIHIDGIRTRWAEDVKIYLADVQIRMESKEIENAEDIFWYLQVSEENALGNAAEALCTDAGGRCYYINYAKKECYPIEETQKTSYLEDTVSTEFFINDWEVILFLKQSKIDALAKEEISVYLHSEVYEGNQYVWINEILDMEGGDNYAIRRIHPNLIDTEGSYLSTLTQDVKGNYPYQTELDGIKKDGYVFHSYYFKNKVSDEITEKFSYAQYYEPFCWIIATGETIEEVYAYSEVINTQSVYQLIVLLVLFLSLFAVVLAVTIKILESQTQNFRRTLLRQTEVFEDIYNALSTGLMRIRVAEHETTILQINPKGLELLGIETEEEATKKIVGYIEKTMDAQDIKQLEEAAKNLKEQWDSTVVECWVTWKDNSRHLLRIRDTLVDFEGNEKIIQRMCQDITEERLEQERALLRAEEKASLDSMTQIKNKKAIETVIRSAIMETTKNNRTIAIGFVDIDNFKYFNTKYGHMQGDEVIRFVANTLKECICGEVGRNGGDEFAFVMFDTSYEKVEQTMQRVHKKLNEGVMLKEAGNYVPAPCSIGVVIENKTDINYDDVMETSDAAMYEAKARGKNTYYIIDHTSDVG